MIAYDSLPRIYIHSTARSETPSPRERLKRVATALWAFAFALPWLVPVQPEPWPTFYSELLAAGVWLTLATWLILSTKSSLPVHRWSISLILLASVPLFQAAAGQFVFRAEAVVVALYILGFAVVSLLARAMTSELNRYLLDALFAGLLFASLLSVGIGLYQWLGLDFLGLLIGPAAPGGRPVANVGQPNNLATLLAWAIVAVWWFYRRESLGGSVAVLCTVYLLIGVALTQSRTGWLQMSLLFLLAHLSNRSFSADYSQHSDRIWFRRLSASVIVALALAFAAFVIAIEPLSHGLQLNAPLSLSQQIDAGKRPLIWTMTLDALAQNPWTGYGWYQGVRAHWLVAQRYPALQVPVGHAHNVILDILLWNGIVLGTLIILGAATWLHRLIIGMNKPEQWILLGGIGIFSVHAMLELPYVYATFLLPLATMVGSAYARLGGVAQYQISRRLMLCVIGGFTVILMQLFSDYRRIERWAATEQLRSAHIAGVPESQVPKLGILSWLQQSMTAIQTQPRSNLSEGELDRMRHTLFRYPTAGAILRYARSAALSGRADEAQWALQHLALMHSAATCRSALREWSALSASEEHAVVKYCHSEEVRSQAN